MPNPQVNKLTITGQTQGSILYFNGTAWVQLGPGADGYVLTTHSSGQNPTWSNISSISVNYWNVANWYINASTGSDSNDGLTSLTPFKTIERLNELLCPNGDVAFLKQTTTVYVAAGTYGKPYFNIGSGSLIIDCAITSSANITLNAVTNTVPSTSTRNEIETASGTFVDYERIRVTGGTQVGALAFSTGLNLSVNKTFTTAFLNSSGSQSNLSVSDTVAIETLSVNFSTALLLTTSDATIKVNNSILTSCNCSSSVTLNNCNIVNGSIIGGANLTFCSIKNSNISNGYYTGFGNQFLGASTSSFSEFNFISTNVFDDCNSFIGQDVYLNFTNIELINRINSVGLIFGINSRINVNGYLWSGTGSYSTSVVQMKSGSYFSFTNLPTVSGTTNISIAGVNFSWSQLPQNVGGTIAEFNTTYTSTANDIAYWTGSYWNRLAANNDGYILTTHGTSSPPTWSSITGPGGFLGSSSAGKALINNGASWVAGGGGAITDNYFGIQNLRTDGYVSASSLRLPNDGYVSFRNVSNTGDFTAIKQNSGTLAMYGETVHGGVSWGGGGQSLGALNYAPSFLSLSIQAVADGDKSFMGFEGSAAQTSCSFWISSTARNNGIPLILNGQNAGVNGGKILIASGSSIFGAGPQGNIYLQLGGIVNGIPSGVGIGMMEITNLGTSNSPRAVISLFNANALTATEMPANTGHKVAYIASAVTAPTANPVGGGIIYAGPNGEFLTRSALGDMRLGGHFVSSVSTVAQTLSLISQSNSGANSRGGLLAIASGTGVPLDPNVNASDGYITISRGANIVANWGDGYSDYISFGTSGILGSVGQNSPRTASSGTIRFPWQGSIKARSYNNTGDLNVYSSNALNQQIFGDQLTLNTILQSGAAGIVFNAGGVNVGGINQAELTIASPFLGFANNASSATIGIRDGGGATFFNQVGKTLLVTAQSVTGVTNRGGSLALASGTGVPLDPNVNASDGYITISRGNNIVANWGDGYSDYVSFGSKFKPSATIGNIRVPNNTVIIGARDKNNGSNISVLSIDAANQITLGDAQENVFINATAGGGIGLQVGSVNKIVVNSNLINIVAPTMTFDTTSSNVLVFGNSDYSSVGATAQTLNIKGGNNSGLASRGTALNLASGTGVPLNTNINASDGYVTISRGLNAVASWTDGYGDFISFGSKFNPASTTGTIRLSKNGIVSFRNSTNSADIAAIQISSGSLVLNGETASGGITFLGGNSILLNVGNSGSQSVMTLADGTTSIMQFNGGGGLGAACLQIHSTSANTGAPLVINAQEALLTGGALALSSGGGATVQGRIAMQLGGYINGNSAAGGLQLLELVNLGSTSVPRGIVSLCNTYSLTSTYMPANTGNGVIYIANASTVPTANSVGGGILYVEGGALKYRGTSGTSTIIAPA